MLMRRLPVRLRHRRQGCRSHHFAGKKNNHLSGYSSANMRVKSNHAETHFYFSY